MCCPGCSGDRFHSATHVQVNQTSLAGFGSALAPLYQDSFAPGLRGHNTRALTSAGEASLPSIDGSRLLPSPEAQGRGNPLIQGIITTTTLASETTCR
jgi:hypothetical protein